MEDIEKEKGKRLHNNIHCEVCGEEEIYEYVDLRLYRVIQASEDYPDRKPYDVNGGTVMCGKCLLGGMTEVCEPITVLSVEEEECVRQRKDRRGKNHGE